MVTDTSKSLRFQKTQMFSQMIDQKEHKNNRYKFEPATWCYKHHSNAQYTWSSLLLLCDTPGYILLSATHATVAVKCTAISVFCFTYVIHRCSSPAVCYWRCHNFFCADALNLLH